MRISVCCLLFALLVSPLSAAAQMTSSKTVVSSTSADVPKLVKFSGTATDEAGKPITGLIGVTFSLYKDQQGGAPLWIETQNVQANVNGHYTAMLGASTSNGVPLELFSSAEAHWVGTQISGQREQPRILLLSVPYALKAADAETLGGLPASAFVHAAPNAAIGAAGAKTSSSASTMAPAAGVTGKGTKNYIPIWTSGTALGNSAIYQTGGQVGVGTKTPGAEVDSFSAGIAVRGTSSGATGVGLSGIATSSSGVNVGVYGQTASTANGATAVFGGATGASGTTFGVQAVSASAGGTGVAGSATAATGSTIGVYGQSASTSGVGVEGNATATSGYTVGVQSAVSSANGVAGLFSNVSGAGLILNGLSGSNYKQVFYVDASGNGLYAGNLNVTGKLTKGSGSFKIDHPLDPKNKYLSHSFVESPDMMNVYNGNVTTDRHGLATVVLPDYFEALNGDFRYQLTVMGKFAQAIVAKEIANNRFVIRTNKPNVKVSWQVTGIRHDAYANAYRIPTEEDKPAAEQGYYLHPEVFGQPASKSVQAASQKASATDQLARMSHP